MTELMTIMLHQLLALRSQVESLITLVESQTCKHPKEQRQYLTGFGVSPMKYLCQACGCEIEEAEEVS